VLLIKWTHKGTAFLWKSILKSYKSTLKSYKSDGLHHRMWKNWRADTKNPRDSLYYKAGGVAGSSGFVYLPTTGKWSL